MIRPLALSLAMVGLLLSGAAQAADKLETVLQKVPADALGFIALPALAEADRSYQSAVEELGLTPFVTPPMNSLASMLRTQLQMSDGLNEQGALILIMMPTDIPVLIQEHTVMLAPATDGPKLLTAMGAERGEGQLWDLEMAGVPMFGMVSGDHVAISQSDEALKQCATGGANVTSKLKAPEKKAMEGQDLVAWLDGQRMVKLFRPQIEPFLNMMTMMQQAGGPGGAAQAELNRRNIEMLLNGIDHFLLTINLSDAGLGIRYGISAVPDSQMAKQYPDVKARKTLLNGLPSDPFMFAFGVLMDPKQVERAAGDFDAMFAGLESDAVNVEKLHDLRDALKAWLPLNTRMALSIHRLPAGAGGMVGLAAVFDVTDTDKWMQQMGKLVAAGKGTPNDPDAEELLAALTHEAGATTVGDAKFDRLHWDLSKIAPDEDEVADMATVFGKDPLTAWFGPAGKERVVLMLGGDKGRLEQVVARARDDGDPLAQADGIDKVSKHLPAERESEMFFAVDTLLRTVVEVMEAVDEEAPPLITKPIHAPLGFAAFNDNETLWSQGDIFVPMDLIRMIKANVQMMMGMGGPTPTDDLDDSQQ